MMKSEILHGVIVKSVGGTFSVLSESGLYECFSPKKFRYKCDDVIVGDKVDFAVVKAKRGVIDKIYPRKNKLSRPEIANVDVCFVVLAAEPKPDFSLCDKVLVNCFKQKICPVVVVNKIDLDGELLVRAQKNYSAIADVVGVSAANGNVEELLPYIKGNLVCFAGQSAVGKTSLLNALSVNLREKTGEISDKSGRGTHTTRHIGIHSVFGGLVADTCGFSLCDLADVRSDELRLYFDDFVEIGRKCKFSSCVHVAEPDCAVKDAVQAGVICKERYERYLQEYAELVEDEKKMY